MRPDTSAPAFIVEDGAVEADDGSRAGDSDARLGEIVPETSDGFSSWVRPHLAVLRALADREVGSAAGSDVVQEALLRAWRRRATFRSELGTPRSWLIAILFDQARRHRLRRPLSRPVVERAESAGPSGDRIDVERAVARLPRRQRQVITLHYLADLPVAEVAAVLGIGESSVKTHLGAARSALRALLEAR